MDVTRARYFDNSYSEKLIKHITARNRRYASQEIYFKRALNKFTGPNVLNSLEPSEANATGNRPFWRFSTGESRRVPLAESEQAIQPVANIKGSRLFRIECQ